MQVLEAMTEDTLDASVCHRDRLQAVMAQARATPQPGLSSEAASILQHYYLALRVRRSHMPAATCSSWLACCICSTDLWPRCCCSCVS